MVKLRRKYSPGVSSSCAVGGRAGDAPGEAVVVVDAPQVIGNALTEVS
jgi:hypothetical protein